MAFEFEFDEWIDALRPVIRTAYGLDAESLIPEVSLRSVWPLGEEDLPLAMIENPAIEFQDGNKAVHDEVAVMNLRFWYLYQPVEGDHVPSVLRGKQRSLLLAFLADPGMGGVFSWIRPRGIDVSGSGADWPVASLEQFEDLAGSYSEFSFGRVENRFSP